MTFLPKSTVLSLEEIEKSEVKGWIIYTDPTQLIAVV